MFPYAMVRAEMATAKQMFVYMIEPPEPTWNYIYEGRSIGIWPKIFPMPDSPEFAQIYEEASREYDMEMASASAETG